MGDEASTGRRTLDEFRGFYETDLLPALQPLEGRRRKILRILGVVLLVVVGILGGLWLGFRSEVGNNPQLLMFGGFGAAIVMGITWWALTKGFVRDFKNGVVGPIVRFCDPGLTYAPGQYVSQMQFEESRIFLHRIDRYKGEDLVQGRLGATQLAFSEIHAQYKTTTTDSKGHQRTQWHTIFKGLFFVADFNKHFAGTTVVLPDMAQRLFGFLGQRLQEMNLARHGQLVKLEDPEFEKLFVVYGTDQVEARYVLSTSLMKRICDFRKKTGRTIHLSFVRSNVCVALQTRRNMFEPRIFRTLLSFDLVKEYLEDLLLATGIVEDLNLNTRIWTKT